MGSSYGPEDYDVKKSRRNIWKCSNGQHRAIIVTNITDIFLSPSHTHTQKYTNSIHTVHTHTSSGHAGLMNNSATVKIIC